MSSSTPVLTQEAPRVSRVQGILFLGGVDEEVSFARSHFFVKEVILLAFFPVEKSWEGWRKEGA